MLKKIKWSLFAILLSSQISGCAPKPPDVPACEKLTQRISVDPVSGHTLLTPSAACMQNLSEAECGHCVWIVSGMERFIGETHKQIPLQSLIDSGNKDAQGKPIFAWKIQVDNTGKPIMVSSWLNDKKPWSQVDAESARLPAEESYSPLATYIINACKKMGCNDAVDAFKVKLNSLNGLGAVIP